MNASATTDEMVSMLMPFVGTSKALPMAHAVFEDMRSIRFNIVPSRFNPPTMWDEVGVIRQAEYVLPKNQFNINSRLGFESLEGSFLTCGNLLRLAQCTLLGRKFIPNLWPSTFARRVKGREHLDALNEVWWLKFWRGVESVSPGPKSANHPDFEWQIEIRDGLAISKINLEVKRRTNNINKFFKERRPNASVSDIAKKFGPVSDGTANVAALTLYHNISEEVDGSVRRWLDEQPHLHALLIWTEGHLGSLPLRKYVKQSRRWVEFLLNGPEPEDLKIAGRSCGTLCDADEAPKFISTLARQLDTPKILRPW